jgi:hypothetical protein
MTATDANSSAGFGSWRKQLSGRFHRKRSVAGSLRGIAIAEIDAALAAIADPDADEAETIHTVRQQLKRLRALVRLPRQRLDGWRDENLAFRDLGRQLAGTRDADVLAESFDRLAEQAGITSPRLRAGITSGAANPGGSSESRARLLRGEIAAGLVQARERAAGWRLDSRGFRLLGPGLRRVYRDMRACEKRAAVAPTPANFHAWRKRTKYHANQLALLKPVAPKIFKGYRKVADRLGGTLGEHHDLDALAAAVQRLGDGSKRERLLGAIGKRNRELEETAFRLGDELTAERPDDFVRRLEAGWKNWRQ